MKIDNEEIRFFVLKVPVIKKLNTRIEDDLFKEIPKFLKYLTQLAEIDFSKSRMVFTPEEIESDALETVKEESRSGLFKELFLLIDHYFNNSNLEEFEANPVDIKNKFFANNNQISTSYIRKVLKNEYKLIPQKIKRYNAFGENLTESIGTPFIFKKLDFSDDVKNVFYKEDIMF
jgi:hypothetical protein